MKNALMIAIIYGLIFPAGAWSQTQNVSIPDETQMRSIHDSGELGTELADMINHYVEYQKQRVTAAHQDPKAAIAKAAGADMANQPDAPMRAELDTRFNQLFDKNEGYGWRYSDSLDKAVKLDNGGTYLQKKLRAFSARAHMMSSLSPPEHNHIVAVLLADYLVNPEHRQVIQDFLTDFSKNIESQVRATYGLDPWIRYLGIGTMIATTGVVILDIRSSFMESGGGAAEGLSDALKQTPVQMLKRVKNLRILKDDLETIWASGKVVASKLRSGTRTTVELAKEAVSSREGFREAISDIGLALRNTRNDVLPRVGKAAWNGVFKHIQQVTIGMLTGGSLAALAGFDQESQLPKVDPVEALRLIQIKAIEALEVQVDRLMKRSALLQEKMTKHEIGEVKALEIFKDLSEGANGVFSLRRQYVQIVNSPMGMELTKNVKYVDITAQINELHQKNWFILLRVPVPLQNAQFVDNETQLLSLIQKVDSDARDSQVENKRGDEEGLPIALAPIGDKLGNALQVLIAIGMSAHWTPTLQEMLKNAQPN